MSISQQKYIDKMSISDYNVSIGQQNQRKGSDEYGENGGFKKDC